MNRIKCPQCGLVNLASDLGCRRCGASLADVEEPLDPLELGASTVPESSVAAAEQPSHTHRPAIRLTWVLATTLVLVFAAYLSLLLTADDLQLEQRQAVRSAIGILEQKGFGRQAFVLRNLVKFRRNDNWWNRYISHHDAYAATNFPFEVVTLYPEFFAVAVDDTERAAILLHESYHLFGSGEERALEGAWRDKQRLGWTAEGYRQTRVWYATEQLTRAQFPVMFTCGPAGQADCF